MNRRLFFTKLAATVALLAASPVVGRVIAPPKWVIGQWFTDSMDRGTIFGVGVEAVSGNEMRRHMCAYQVDEYFDIEATIERSKAKLTEWVDNLNEA